MITNTKILEKYCTDYQNIQNYAEAVKSPLRYDLHHRHEISENKSASDLIDENLYYHRPPEELIFLEHKEHVRLHNAGKQLSTETRQKMSDAKKGNQYALGWHCSEETKQKISESKKGKNLSAETRKRMSNAKKNMSVETRQKISEAMKGNQNTFGHHFSEETKQRMSDVKKGRHWHLENGHRIWTE